MTTEMKLYQSEDLQVRLDVLVENETVWLNQAQIGALFGVQKSAISKHLKHIFDSGELRQEAVVSILETTAADGKDISQSSTILMQCCLSDIALTLFLQHIFEFGQIMC